MSFSVTLLGATGLIGQNLLKLLLDDSAVKSVTCISRRPLDTHSDKLRTVIAPLDQLQAHSETFQSDQLICCLGTTIKAAGSKSAFRQVDYDFVINAAQLAKQQGAQHMCVVSAVGADSDSPFFYNKVKGEMENALKKLNFAGLHIIRPSLLLGERNERRLAEDLSKPFTRALSPLLIGHLKRYQPISGVDVAKKMFSISKHPMQGVNIIYPTL